MAIMEEIMSKKELTTVCLAAFAGAFVAGLISAVILTASMIQ